MASTWDVDAALLAKLQADTALVALVPDGIYFGEARTGALKWLQVTQIDHDDETMFERVAYETVLYQIVAIMQDTSPVGAINAGVRVHTVMKALTPTSFTPTNYRLMDVHRTTRLRYNERDTANVDRLWQHDGAQYEMRLMPTG